MPIICSYSDQFYALGIPESILMSFVFLPPNSSGIGHLSLEAINYAGRFAGFHDYDKFYCVVDRNILRFSEFAAVMRNWFEYIVIESDSTKYNVIATSWKHALSTQNWHEKHAYRIFADKFPAARQLYPYPYYSTHKVLRALNSSLNFVYDKNMLSLMTLKVLSSYQIRSPYVLIHIRDTPLGITSDPRRNVPISHYRHIVKYWLSNNYSVVRLGYGAPLPFRHNNLYDFNSIFAHPNTLSLIGGADIVIGCQSGPSLFAGIFGIPCVLLNVIDEYDVLMIHDFPGYHIIPSVLLGSPDLGVRLDEIFGSILEGRKVDYRLSPNAIVFKHARLHV
jgi:hypothetical protein